VSTAGGALLVLGNRKGDVVAFNTVLGDMAWRAQGCHTGCVQRLFTRPALVNVMVQQEVRQVMTKPEINPYYTEAQAEADTFTSDILMSHSPFPVRRSAHLAPAKRVPRVDGGGALAGRWRRWHTRR
jgi:hypothetical protein